MKLSFLTWIRFTVWIAIGKKTHKSQNKWKSSYKKNVACWPVGNSKEGLHIKFVYTFVRNGSPPQSLFYVSVNILYF